MARRDGQDLLHPVRQGGTLLDVMWGDLISCIDTLMNSAELELENEDRLKGRAEGVAWCIAVLTQSPGIIDISLIKDEAMSRWETGERNGSAKAQ